MLSEKDQTELRLRLMANQVRQVDVAAEMEMDPGLLSNILNRRRKSPDQFAERFHRAVDNVLERRAAEALAAVQSPSSAEATRS